MLLKTHFLASENHFLPLPQIFSKKYFIPASRNTFFRPEEKVLLFTQFFFPASGDHYLNYRKAYLKLLSLILATIFFDFSNISGKQFFRLVETLFLNKFFIPTSGKRFSVYLKQFSFISRFFSASRNPIFEKKTLFLLVETDFLVRTDFLSIFRHSCHWYWHLFVNKSCILVRH